MRIALAVLFGLHGLVHLIGFVVPFRLADLASEGFAYGTTLLGGRIDVGDAGMRVVGVLWFLVAVLFVIAAVGVALGAAWAPGLAVVAAVLSLVLCVLQWSVASAGGYLDLAILVFLAANARFGWLRF